MKNMVKLFGIIAFVAIIGFTFTSCENDITTGGNDSGTPGYTPDTNEPGQCTPGSIPVTGVSLNNSTLTILIGDMETLSATITPYNATNQNITWSSSNTSVATVSAGGVVTAEGIGSVTITVTTSCGSRTASSTVTVNPVVVTGVSLGLSTSLVVGGTETLFPEITPSNATNQNVTWNSNNNSVATVSPNGEVTAIGVGTATITVTTVCGNLTTTIAVTVSTLVVPPTGVSVLPATVNLNVGGTQALTRTIMPSNATNQNVTWSSNNNAVATVSAGGLVTAVGIGTATITVTTVAGGFQATSTINVNPVLPTGVSLNKTATSLDVGGTETLFATVIPFNATNQNVTWSSNNTAVATVSQSGLVTAVSAGTATIIVTTQVGNFTASCVVTVVQPNLIAQLNSLQINAQSGGNYVLNINANESIGPQNLYFSGRSNITITLRNTGPIRTISLASNGTLFEIPNGITLVLEDNIVLQGRSNNSGSIITIRQGGTFIMEGGTISGNAGVGRGGGVFVGGTLTMNGGTISGNTSSFNGGGVYVGWEAVGGGIFTMNGGTISGNTSSFDGGGVAVWTGTFIMNNGTISGNFSGTGGGVSVWSGSTFTMKGGTISDNTANHGGDSGGGGVFVRGTFIMEGGTILRNTMISTMGAAGSQFDGGGGVRIAVLGAFTKSGNSIITGWGDDTVNGNVVRAPHTGTPLILRGHAVSFAFWGNNIFDHHKRRETTVGAGEDLAISGRNPPTYSGSWDCC